MQNNQFCRTPFLRFGIFFVTILGLFDLYPRNKNITPPVLLEKPSFKVPDTPDIPAGRHTIVFSILIDENGKVKDAVVVKGTGTKLDEICRKEILKFKFSPAKVNGVPVPVRIKYNFTINVKKHKKKVVTIKGVVYEKGSRKRVSNLLIYLLDRKGTILKQAVTDGDGNFSFSNTGYGFFTVFIPEGVFEEKRIKVEVKKSKKPVFLKIKLRKLYDYVYTTVIKKKKEYTSVVVTSLSIEEIEKMPGAFGDPFKTVQNLPGVMRPTGLSGQIVVLGSTPQESRVLLEGLNFGMLYHFGGIYSVINANIIKNIDFYSGGFSVLYGNATGGIVEVELDDRIDDYFHGYVDLNLFQTGVFFKFPVSKKTNVTFAAKRSYIDFVLGYALKEFEDEVGMIQAPRYYDYQLKVDHYFDDKTFLSLLLYGYDDRFSILFKKATEGEPYFSGEFDLALYTHNLFLLFKKSFSRKFKVKASLQTSYTFNNAELGKDIFFKIYGIPIDFKSYFNWKIADFFKLTAGGGISYGYIDFKIRAPDFKPGEVNPPVGSTEFLEEEENTNSFYSYLFFIPEFIVKDKLFLMPQLRLNFFSGYWNDFSFDPRFIAKYSFSDTLTLKFGCGIYTRAPDAFELSNVFGTNTVDHESAAHFMAGFKYLISDNIDIDTEFFYKYLYDLVVSNADPLAKDKFVNDGVGRAYGLQFIAKIMPKKDYYGWIAYTLMKSERKDHPSEEYYPFRYDQRHILTLLFGKKFKYNLSVTLRFRLVSGNPVTPIEKGIYDADFNAYTPVQSEKKNSVYMPMFHQLDVRIDKTFVFNSWKLSLYLDIQNIYNHRNPEGLIYNYDYTEKSYLYGLPILPVLGIKGEF